ncbi:conserved protein of unknown function [Tenacibaculum sp. 190130A14a]|uniref:Uncharacterized protein n=1 Tax=Tenacibaculum polynesiense TaxID=3137857 RepID=A0ABM9PF26_9FLAO
MKNTTQKKNYIKPLFWVVLLSSWLLFGFPMLWWLPFICWLVFLIVLIVRKSHFTWKLLLFSSWSLLPLLSFVGGIGNYLGGNAHLKGVGYPGFGFSNLDKEYRVYHASSGCIVVGNEFFTHAPNNLAVKLCTKVFGVEKGVYAGFYPTPKEANEIIKTSGVILPYHLTNERIQFEVDKKRYEVPFDGPVILNEEQSKQLPKVQMALYKKELIVLKVIDEEQNQFIYLIDRVTGKTFCVYFLRD